MGVSFKIDTSFLQRLVKAYDDPAVKAEYSKIPQEKAVAGIIGQAIADNFAKEGPGWPALSARTIRESVKKHSRPGMTNPKTGEFIPLAEMTDSQILNHELKVRLKQRQGDQLENDRSEDQPFRRILQRTGLLKMTVTTPNWQGSRGRGKNQRTGSNIYKVEGTNIIWGTDLAYASIHNNGEVDPVSGIKMPKRKFLFLAQEWKDKLSMYVLRKVNGLILDKLVRNL